MAEVFSYKIGFDSFDLTLLPTHARTPGTDAFRAAVTQFLEAQYRHFGGRVRIVINDDAKTINVEWSPSARAPEPAEVVLEMLKRGDYKTAVPLLIILRHQEPTNPQHAYNLGMALSDMGQLDRAEAELHAALRFAPDLVNAKVALGVALLRKGDDVGGTEILREAVAQEPANPWALRNLGAGLLRTGQPREAEIHLRRAAYLLPDDQQTLLGLGKVLQALDKTEEADELFIKVISLGSATPAGEAAKDARRELAQLSFRERSGGVERMDAVMYCLGALEKFGRMPKSQVQQIGFEIAVVGMKGLDTNDSTQKYSLKSLPGRFSGLHLVCLMYVAFKIFAPEQDVGFDLSREYAAALKLHKK